MSAMQIDAKVFCGSSILPKREIRVQSVIFRSSASIDQTSQACIPKRRVLSIRGIYQLQSPNSIGNAKVTNQTSRPPASPVMKAWRDTLGKYIAAIIPGVSCAKPVKPTKYRSVMLRLLMFKQSAMLNKISPSETTKVRWLIHWVRFFC